MIEVRNVGEAKHILKANGIKVLSHKYIEGNRGTVIVDGNLRDAAQLLRGYGL